MSRSGAERGGPGPTGASATRRRRGWPSAAVGAVVWAALATPGGAAGQPAELPSEPQPLELTVPVRSELALLQETWLDWLAAANQDDVEGADLALAELQAGAARLGLHRLPDLSLGAAAFAVRAAGDGAFERAELALAAADRLDPGLAEPEFARALVAKRQGGRSLALLAAVRHIAGSPLLTRLAVASLSLWLLGSLLVAAVGFVAVAMATRGRQLVRRLYSWLERLLPGPACLLLTLLILLWPLVLPSGPVLLVVYWTVLLWGHGGRLERVVLTGVILLLGVTPVLINEQRKALSVALSAPVRAVESVATGRLTGTLFSDLGLLRAVLPDSLPVKHLLADVHTMLGQWSPARPLYVEVIEAEPENFSALVDAGVCFFQLGDLERAIDLFRQATALDDRDATAYFNLSQTYSELLRFEESARSLQEAQRRQPQQVGRWLTDAEELKVVPARGGLERSTEIRRQVAAAWRSGEVKPTWLLSLPLAALFLAIAVALHLVLRRAGRRAVRPGDASDRRSPAFWQTWLLPGYAEALAQQWGRVWAALVVPSALLGLVLFNDAGFTMPWLLAPMRHATWWLAGFGLAAWLAVRYWRTRRAAG